MKIFIHGGGKFSNMFVAAAQYLYSDRNLSSHLISLYDTICKQLFVFVQHYFIDTNYILPYVQIDDTIASYCMHFLAIG